MDEAIIKCLDKKPICDKKQINNNERVIIRYFHDTKNIFISKYCEKDVYNQVVLDVSTNQGIYLNFFSFLNLP